MLRVGSMTKYTSARRARFSTGQKLLSVSRRLLADLTRTPQRAARLGAGVLAVFNDLHAIHEHMFHANGVLMRFLECSAIRNRRGIEDNDVGEHAFFNETAMIETEIGGRQCTQSSHRFSQREHLFVPNIFA